MPPVKANNPYAQQARAGEAEAKKPAGEAEAKKPATDAEKTKVATPWVKRVERIATHPEVAGVTRRRHGEEDEGSHMYDDHAVTITDDEGTSVVLTFSVMSFVSGDSSTGFRAHQVGLEIDALKVIKASSTHFQDGRRNFEKYDVHIPDAEGIERHDLGLSFGLKELTWDEQKEAIEEILTAAEESLGLEPFEEATE